MKKRELRAPKRAKIGNPKTRGDLYNAFDLLYKIRRETFIIKYAQNAHKSPSFAANFKSSKVTVRQVRIQTKNTETNEILEVEFAKNEGTFPAFAIPLRILEAAI